MQMRMPRLFVIFAGLVIAIALALAGPANAAGRVSSGTGFFVSKRGYLITNFHVVESCRPT
jgi:S1-C subfamily serine protease